MTSPTTTIPTLTEDQLKAIAKIHDCVELEQIDGTWEHYVFRVEHPVCLWLEGERFYTKRETRACLNWLKTYAPESEYAGAKL